MEISLRDYIISFLRHWKIVVLAVVLCVGGVVAYSFLFMDKSSRIETTVMYDFVVLITSPEGEVRDASKLSHKDLEESTLSKFYDVLMSRKVFHAIMRSENRPKYFTEYMDKNGYKDFQVMNMIKLEKGTTSYKLIASVPDPEFGKQLLMMYNTVGIEVAEPDAISSKDELGVKYNYALDVKVLDEPWETVGNGQGLIRSTIMGGLLGVVLAAGIVALLHITGERLRAYKDIDPSLDIALLGAIPPKQN